MKLRSIGLALTLSLLVSCSVFAAQDRTTVTASTSQAAEGLDLRAVAELFKDSKDLEDFEKRLNDPSLGVNNLDLNEDGDVDFIRVLAEAIPAESCQSLDRRSINKRKKRETRDQARPPALRSYDHMAGPHTAASARATTRNKTQCACTEFGNLEYLPGKQDD